MSSEAVAGELSQLRRRVKELEAQNKAYGAKTAWQENLETAAPAGAVGFSDDVAGGGGAWWNSSSKYGSMRDAWPAIFDEGAGGKRASEVRTSQNRGSGGAGGGGRSKRSGPRDRDPGAGLGHPRPMVASKALGGGNRPAPSSRVKELGPSPLLSRVAGPAGGANSDFANSDFSEGPPAGSSATSRPATSPVRPKHAHVKWSDAGTETRVEIEAEDEEAAAAGGGVVPAEAEDEGEEGEVGGEEEEEGVVVERAALDVEPSQPPSQPTAVFAVGARVECRHGGGEDWYAGEVASVAADGTYYIQYDDGDEEEGVEGDLVRDYEGTVGEMEGEEAGEGEGEAEVAVRYDHTDPGSPIYIEADSLAAQAAAIEQSLEVYAKQSLTRSAVKAATADEGAAEDGADGDEEAGAAGDAIFADLLRQEVEAGAGDEDAQPQDEEEEAAEDEEEEEEEEEEENGEESEAPQTPNGMAASKRRNSELAAAMLDDLFGDDDFLAPDPTPGDAADADADADAGAGADGSGGGGGGPDADEGDDSYSDDGYDDEFDDEEEG